MRRLKRLTLSATLAAAVFGAAPAVAYASFRDDGSVVVDRGVLDTLGPQLKRPGAPSSDGLRLRAPGEKRPGEKRQAKAKPAKAVAPAKTAPKSVAVAEPPKVVEPVKPEPPKVAEPAKPEPQKIAEPAKPEPQKIAEPPKVAEPAKPGPPKPLETTPEPPRTRLVGVLTGPHTPETADIPAPVPTPKPTPAAITDSARPSAPPPAHALATPAETKVAAITPAAPPSAAATPPPTPRGLVTPQPPVQAQPQPPAKVEPAASRAGTGIEPQRNGGLRMRFPAGDATLPEGSHTALEAVARRMEADPQLYLQLLAYAEGSEEEASKARRLSLSRALAVRSYLMNYGVRSTRIEVRALGNKVPDGPADRVDLVIDKR